MELKNINSSSMNIEQIPQNGTYHFQEPSHQQFYNGPNNNSFTQPYIPSPPIPQQPIPPQSIQQQIPNSRIPFNTPNIIVGDPRFISIICEIVIKQKTCCGIPKPVKNQPKPIQVIITMGTIVKDLKKQIESIFNTEIISLKIGNSKLRDNDLVAALVGGYNLPNPIRFQGIGLIGCC